MWTEALAWVSHPLHDCHVTSNVKLSLKAIASHWGLRGQRSANHAHAVQWAEQKPIQGRKDSMQWLLLC